MALAGARWSGFSRRELRAALLATLSLAAGFAWGQLANSPLLAAPAPAALAEPEPNAAVVPEKTAALLAALGYLPDSEPAPALKGVTTHLRGLAHPGLNLAVSRHAPEARLLDMKGRELHRWRLAFEDAFPDRAGLVGVPGIVDWRRVALRENGDLLAIFEGAGLIMVDKDSRLLWANPLAFHHDVFVDEAGTIYALTQRAHVLPRIHPAEPVVEDFITVLDASGRALRHVSILEAFERSSYASILRNLKPAGDILHTNTIELVPNSASKRVLISVRELSVIAIVDLEDERVVWALSGQWHAQHQPTFLADGNLLLFDNQGHGELSKVIEIDPFSQEIVWSYAGTPENGFYSRTCGSNQRLENGNTLITQSNSGRAFEVTREGRIVWEYYNPARTGDQNDLIATLYELVRLPETHPPWLD